MSSKSNDIKFLFNGMMFDCPKEVYYPSEDSYFLAQNTHSKKNSVCIEMGCGSGIQSLNLLFKKAGRVHAIDINPLALEATEKNCRQAGFGEKITTHKSGLFEKYSGEKADLIVFNPPYVPSEASVGKKYLDLDGGKNGRETLDLFLNSFPKHLKEKGKCVFLQTDINGYAQTKKILAKKGFSMRIIAKQRGFFEELAVCEAQRKRK